MSEGPFDFAKEWGPEHLRVREARAEARRIARELRHGFRHASLQVELGVGPRGHAEEHEQTSERTFDVKGMPTLRVANMSGDTRISAGDPGRVTVRARKYVRGVTADRAQQLLDSFEVRMEQEGDTIVVKPLTSDQERFWRDLFRGRRVAVDLEIVVPRECGIDASSTSGDLGVTGIHGPLSIQNVSGDTALADLQGPLRLRTVSGDVRVSAFAGLCECNSVSGDLRIEGSRLRAADLQTVSGDLSVDGALEGGAVHRVRTVSGDIELALAGSSFKVDYRTLSGDLECACPARVAREGRRDRLVIVGDGEVHVQVKTVSGDLRLGVAGSIVPEPAAGAAETGAAGEQGPVPAAEASDRQAAARAVLDRVASGELTVADAVAALDALRAAGR